jgi:hypothetical protein
MPRRGGTAGVKLAEPGCVRVAVMSTAILLAPSPGRRRLLAAGGAWAGSLAGLLGGCSIAPRTRPSADDAVAPDRVPRISDSPVDAGVPTGWSPYVLRRDRAETRYRLVERDGRRVLEATAVGASTALQAPVDVAPQRAPRLRWSWRVDALIDGADVSDDDRDDAPARLVLGFDVPGDRLGLRDVMFFEQVELFTGKRLPNASIVYCWDPRLPVGTWLTSPRTRRIRYLVVESGTEGLGRWRAYERDWTADFRAAFDEPPGPIRTIGVLTDSDDLKQTARAWYGDIDVGPR